MAPAVTDRLVLLSEEIEFLLAEASVLAAAGPTFTIVVACNHGEELRAKHLLATYLTYRGRQWQIPLSRSLLWFFHYLALHRWTHQTASQVAQGIRRDRFYAVGRNDKPWRLAHSTPKEYVKRLRRALEVVLADAGLGIDANRVVESKPVDGKHVLYRLRGDVDVIQVAAGLFDGPSEVLADRHPVYSPGEDPSREPA